MTQADTDIQSTFLETLIAERKTVWVFLVSGIKLTGLIESFDKYVLAVQSPNGIQTIYKNAISTVCEPHTLPPKRTDERASMTRVERAHRK
ncbi:RNA chaperone Hfq [Caballeronia sp. LP006]|jgi:host factor-I protein|uniref:RNA chaperone Hfq n=1 Tax=unclassified Caballeronia TaxID=2646786 RepID=UPI00202790B4|nr:MULTISPECIES: RNA chaperone Hfq [unclassified Caballeronia]MDR5773439.1 RNA chaperone Hfq [Caballeronia sp. LZ002]MDR5806216.1 RNA chaperone Hfq [Caballeronia sp. LZ001]MDR5826664.1 RNA chaperone Hfq [Caballeronia sp. LP006]MDR5848873.1 RNA chaperone Hfq [Caballeronia sp. LZ003]